MALGSSGVDSGLLAIVRAGLEVGFSHTHRIQCRSAPVAAVHTAPAPRALRRTRSMECRHAYACIASSQVTTRTPAPMHTQSFPNPDC